jgi:hypothetical protein
VSRAAQIKVSFGKNLFLVVGMVFIASSNFFIFSIGNDTAERKAMF